MRGPWRIGRILGIDICVDWSWFLILLLMTYSLGFLEFPRELHPRTLYPRADVLSVGMGLAVSLMLFASVLAHELAHSWMALERGIPVASITLFIFGGVARIADEPDRPLAEFSIALMGPLMSIALASVCGAAWLWLRIIGADGRAFLGGETTLALVPPVLFFGILAQANGALALFNLAPGFPLDGGRILRACLWGLLHDFGRATRWATRSGQAIALLLIAGGAWLLLTEFSATGIWYAVIGSFLWGAARDGYRQAVSRSLLDSVRVGQIMTRHIERVAPDATLEDFVADHVLSTRDEVFAVSCNDTLLGIIPAAAAQRVPRSEWTSRCVGQMMTPLARVDTLRPEQTAGTALTRLTRSATEELPVLNGDGELVGFLGRSQLSRLLKLRL